MKVANPNEMVAIWILTILGKEKGSIPMRIILVTLLPFLPVFWLLWWTGYIAGGLL